MSKKIVVLCGSPRKGGNTETLADALIRGAESVGHTVTKFHTRDYPVNGCMHCNACLKNPGHCAQEDGMQDIYPSLYEADLIVFASPVYFYAMTSHIKAMMDRMFVVVRKPFPVQSSILLLTYGDREDEAAEPSVVHYETMLRYLKWENLGIIKAAGVMDKGDIAGHPSLQAAEALGRRIL